MSHAQQLEQHLDRFEERQPRWFGKTLEWLWKPQARWVRIPVGILLILAGIVGFLPILGFWMVPLGLIVLAKDFTPLQPVLVRFLDWVERKWPAKGKSN